MLNFGFDPEVFFTEKSSVTYDNFIGEDFVISPAVLHKHNGLEFIGGDIKHPILAKSKRVKIVMDGVAAEINSTAPVRTGKEIRALLDESLDMLYGIANKHSLDVTIKPVVNFDYKKYYTEEATKDIQLLQGLIFGCDADEDAFDQSFECKILDVSSHPYRYGGGHFHISGIDSFDTEDNGYLINSRAMAQLFALTVGNFSVVTALYPELEQLRGSYYGKAGKYRPQDYGNMKGVEYRTPSNNWVNLDANVLEQFLDLFKVSVDWYYNKAVGKAKLETFLAPTLTAIRTADKALATYNLEDLGLM